MQIYMLQTLQLIVNSNPELTNEFTNKLTPVEYGDGKVYFIVKETEEIID